MTDPITTAELVRHVKRGTTYQVVGEAKLQTSGSIAEGAMLTIYRGVNSGALWARPTDEFRDGRFVTLSHPVPLPDTERKLALAVKALRHARDQILHPDQLIDDALAAIANQEPQS